MINNFPEFSKIVNQSFQAIAKSGKVFEVPRS